MPAFTDSALRFVTLSRAIRAIDVLFMAREDRAATLRPLPADMRSALPATMIWLICRHARL